MKNNFCKELTVLHKKLNEKKAAFDVEFAKNRQNYNRDKLKKFKNAIEKTLKEIKNYPAKKIDFFGKGVRRDQIPFLEEISLQLFLDNADPEAIDWFKNHLWPVPADEWAFKRKDYGEIDLGVDKSGYLIKLVVNDKKLTKLPPLPKHLRGLNCNDNKLESLPDLPEGMSAIVCSNNNIKDLPILPQSIFVADFRNNPLSNNSRSNLSRHRNSRRFEFDPEDNK